MWDWRVDVWLCGRVGGETGRLWMGVCKGLCTVVVLGGRGWGDWRMEIGEVWCKGYGKGKVGGWDG